MCQTRRGESRLKRIYEGIAVNKITSKYLKKGSMSKVGIELFNYICEFCCKIEKYREECRLLSKAVFTIFSFLLGYGRKIVNISFNDFYH